MNLNSRIKKLEMLKRDTGTVVARHQAWLALHRSNEVLAILYNDLKAREAARCITMAYATFAQQNRVLAMSRPSHVIAAMALQADPKARAAWEYYRRAYAAVDAATPTRVPGLPKPADQPGPPP